MTKSHRLPGVGKTKADMAFCKKLEQLIRRPVIHSQSMVNSPWPKVQYVPFDIEAAEKLFNQYGAYLELIDYTHPMTEDQMRSAGRQVNDLVRVL